MNCMMDDETGGRFRYENTGEKDTEQWVLALIKEEKSGVVNN